MAIPPHRKPADIGRGSHLADRASLLAPIQSIMNPDPRKTLNRHDAKVAKDTIFAALDRRI